MRLEPQARGLITSYFDGWENDRGEELWDEFDVVTGDLDLGEDGLMLALSVAAELYSIMAVLANMWDRSPTDVWVEMALASGDGDAL